MELINNHPWREIMLSDIVDVGRNVNESNANWEYIDTSIAAMGTIAHAQLDIEKIQERALLLLKETKDMRVVAHLLRTLQHGKKPHEITLALALFADYIENFWQTAAPQPRLKLRLFKQVIQRFAQAQSTFETESTSIEQEVIRVQLDRIKSYFLNQNIQLDDAFIDLDRALTNIATKSAEKAERASSENTEILAQSSSAESKSDLPPAPNITISQHSDTEWKRTLIKVTEILFERNRGDSISFRLRRHAIFSALSEPMNNDGITDLSPMPADRVADYKSNIAKTDYAQWLKIENNLTVMPFWLEGHYISAQIALHLGHSDTANAIKEELQQLLLRLPMLIDFKYSDKSAFISKDMHSWLSEKKNVQQGDVSLAANSLLQCLNDQGLEEALKMLNAQPITPELRNQFHQQYLNAQLFAHAGFNTIAQQQAQSILLACQNLTLSEWEPSFFEALSDIANNNN
ncbi:type VI secretion system protein TssA [Budvicia aquatica]|uniref:Type VI secretion system protein TssA n=2 Tax=Budvicia aquatica TaxID=82979 RepID=A0A2C6DR99_9GAMM|nr:type VI secretion system protein TssA [Budvicia aquatica]PHI31727.1 type VI secretion system protein TssA [Budvicia aquatica]